MNQLKTPDQVAELVQVHPKTVMRAIMAGDLKASQLARRGCWRITEDAVADWIELRASPRRRATPPPPPQIDLALVANDRTVERRRAHRAPQTGRLELPADRGRRAS